MTVPRRRGDPVHPDLLPPDPGLDLERGAHARLDELADGLRPPVHLDERFRRDAQPGGGRALPGGVDPAGGHLRHVPEELAVVRDDAVRHEDVRVGHLDVVYERRLRPYLLLPHDLVPADAAVEAAVVALRDDVRRHGQIVALDDLAGGALRQEVGVLHEEGMGGGDGQRPPALGGEPEEAPGGVPPPDPDRPALLQPPLRGERHDLEVRLGVLPVLHLLRPVDREPVLHQFLDVPFRAVAHEHHGLAGDALGDPGVADKEDVDVPPDLRPVLELLGGAPEQLQGDALLDLLVAVDGRGDGAHDPLEDLGGLRLPLYRLLVLLGDDHLLVLVLLELHGEHREVDVEQGGLDAVALLLAPEDAVQDDAVPGGERPRQVVLEEGREALGLGPSPQPLGGLLHLHLLRVDVHGLLRQQLELGASGRPPAPLLLLVALHRLPEVQPVLRLQDPGGAAHAAEDAEDEPRAHLGGLADQPLHRDEPPEVLAPQVADLDAAVPGELLDAQVHLRGGAGGVAEPPDHLLALPQGAVRVAQYEAGEVGVEPVDLRVGEGQAPHLRKPVREFEQPQSVLLRFQELLPARGYVLVGVIDRQNHLPVDDVDAGMRPRPHQGGEVFPRAIFTFTLRPARRPREGGSSPIGPGPLPGWCGRPRTARGARGSGRGTARPR